MNHALRRSLTGLLLLPCFCVSPALAQSDAKFGTHPPMRPLPTVSHRPLEKGLTYFVDGARGDDTHDGSLAKPWKTIQHGIAQLKPGDTLALRGGTYHQHATLAVVGEPDRPITLRAYPGERVVLDGGLREFHDSSATAWEPCPGGAPGEFQSVKKYPALGGRPDETNMLGHFADSMVPLHGYKYLRDLRNPHMFWKENIRTSTEEGIYCGPGILYDPMTERIHVRLAHTSLKGLHDDNYRGETDPRKTPLVLAGLASGPTLSLRGARNVRVHDLIVRGARTAAVEVIDCRNIEFDGLTVYGGSSCFSVKDTWGLRVLHTACRGIAAPWTFRGSLKYRAIEARIFSASSWTPTGRDNRDFEIAYSEFTDCVDGVFLGNVRRVHFHHNLLDNVSDDGIFLTAGTGYDGVTPGGDIHIYQNVLSRCLTTFAFGVGHGRQRALATGLQTGAGVWIYRNVFDYRRPVMYHQPTGPDAPQEITSTGRIASDHGSPAWEPMHLYHNTILANDPVGYSYSALGLGNAMGHGTRRRVFNNIIVQMEKPPGATFPAASTDFQADGNLHWTPNAEVAGKIDLFAKFRASKVFAESKTRYAPGWTANDRFADPRFQHLERDWRKPVDLRLTNASPAKGMGVALPGDWPDPLGAARGGRPDVGAIPAGTDPWHVGVRGRLDAFGAPRPAAKIVLTPRPFPEMMAAPKIDDRKPAAIVEGYPARDVPLVNFALRKQGAPVVIFEHAWLDTKEYSKYRVVALVGNLPRAKIEHSKYTPDDLARVKTYLEDGGTLLFMLSAKDVFATPDGQKVLLEMVGVAPAAKKVAPRVLEAGHPWLQHLGKEPPAWLANAQVNGEHALRANRGERILGTAEGQTTLYRVRVGKGQLIYVGWEIANSLPATRAKAATLAEEKAFEDQMGILFNVVRELYPDR